MTTATAKVTVRERDDYYGFACFRYSVDGRDGLTVFEAEDALRDLGFTPNAAARLIDEAVFALTGQSYTDAVVSRQRPQRGQ